MGSIVVSQVAMGLPIHSQEQARCDSSSRRRPAANRTRTSTDANPEAAGFDEAMFIAYMKFNEEMHQAGILVASEGLNPAAPGARIAVSQGRRHLVGGPFAESKELVGGLYIIEVDSLEEAIQWALRAPTGPGADDVLEVWQFTGAGDLPPEILQLINNTHLPEVPRSGRRANSGPNHRHIR